MTERVRTLESTLDAKHAEHKQLDQDLARAKDKASSRQIEIDRLTDLLENARTKVCFITICVSIFTRASSRSPSWNRIAL